MTRNGLNPSAAPEQLLLLVGHVQDGLTLRALVAGQTPSRSSSGARPVLGCAGDEQGQELGEAGLDLLLFIFCTGASLSKTKSRYWWRRGEGTERLPWSASSTRTP
jgi:hypothetical protein